MSKVHDAMRNLEHKTVAEPASGSALSSLVGALLGELAHEVPDDPKLETVRADLLAISRTYESCKKKDLALRFYLATRSLLHEYELVSANLRRAEHRPPVPEPIRPETPQVTPEPPALPNGGA
jgi:hypothetical protein